MAWTRIIEWGRCPAGSGVFVEVGGRELAVFRLPDPERPSVIENSCPHAGGNLSGGRVERTVVTCPWHEWRFDLDTGQCTHSEKAAVRRYPCEVRDGALWADI